MARQSQDSRPEPKTYVVGHKSGEFCALVSKNEGELADDQNLESAKCFHFLREAIKVSDDWSASVFEVVEKSGKQTLRELQVDLKLVAKVPYEGAYFVTAFLLAGPSFITYGNAAATVSKVTALMNAGVGCIVSVCARGELILLDEVATAIDLNEQFDHHHIFPIKDGGVPSRGMMRTILDTIDEALDKGHKVFVHCVGGRGRTGLVVGCWLARHGVAVGEATLDKLAEIRYQYGLFKPSPENDKQCRFVREWQVE
jgi:hypothetical protein